MARKVQDGLSIMRLQVLSSSTLSFEDDLLCVQNWMGMVSFLSSQVLGAFGLTKSEKNAFRGAYFNMFSVKNSGGKKMGVKRQIFTRQMGFTLISTFCICWGSYFT